MVAAGDDLVVSWSTWSVNKRRGEGRDATPLSASITEARRPQSAYPDTMADYTVRPLRPDTWDPYAQLIERHDGVWGGGVVEGYLQDTQGKQVSASFSYNGTRGLFEQAGFAYQRPKGKNHCVMRATIAPR